MTKDENIVNRICCCNLKMAGIVVAVVEFLLCILSIYGLFRNLHIFGSTYLIWFILGIISIFIIFIAIGLLLYAIKKEDARFLIPHISAQIFLIAFFAIVILVTLILLLFGAYNGIRRLLGHGNYYMSDNTTIILGYWIIIVYLAVAILESFFLYIIYRLYLYFKKYKRLVNSSLSGTFYSANGKTANYNSNEWYLPPKNEHAYGGSAEAGDIYPYEAPFTAQI